MKLKHILSNLLKSLLLPFENKKLFDEFIIVNELEN
jgi:hypothetical protein